MVQDYDTWHNKKIATWHVNSILENKIKIKINLVAR
jgi:hypothetical protein